MVTVFNIILSFAMLLIFIRFMLQFAGITAQNPLAEPAYKATLVVDMFARILPTLAQGRVSTAAIFIMFVLRMIELMGNAALAGRSLPLYDLLVAGGFSLILSFLVACRFLIIGSIIISWVVVLTQKMHPILGLIMQVAEPILAPFRRITPNLGMIDLSPMVAFLVLIVLEQLVRGLSQNWFPGLL